MRRFYLSLGRGAYFIDDKTAKISYFWNPGSGEAVKNISEDIKDKYKKIEWRKIAGMRDVIIHSYFRVDLDAVWNVIKKDLSMLKKQMNLIKRDLL